MRQYPPHAAVVAECPHDGGRQHPGTKDRCILGVHHLYAAQTGDEDLHLRQLSRRRRGPQDAHDDGPLQACGFFQPFQIAAQPIEIVGDPRGQIAGRAS